MSSETLFPKAKVPPRVVVRRRAFRLSTGMTWRSEYFIFCSLCYSASWEGGKEQLGEEIILRKTPEDQCWEWDKPWATFLFWRSDSARMRTMCGWKASTCRLPGKVAHHILLSPRRPSQLRVKLLGIKNAIRITYTAFQKTKSFLS